MNPSDFLPSFFRAPRRARARYNNDPENLLVPDQKPIVAPGAAPAIVPPVAAPLPDVKPRVTIPYKVPLPDMASAPPPDLAVPAAETISSPVNPADIPRVSGHVYTDSKGRPRPFDEEMDPASTEKTLAVHRAVQGYDPEAQPAKGWKKWVPTMISGALRGFGRGGVGGAIFGAAEGGIGGALDPARANREWQRKKLGQYDSVVAGIQKDRSQQIKDARELAGLEGSMASTELARKRAAELGKPKPGQVKQDENGGWISVDPITKTTAPIVDPLTGKQAKGKPSGEKEEWIHDEDGIAHKYKDGKDTGVTDPGRRLVNVPGYGMMSPASARSADAIEGRETAAATERATIAAGKARTLQAESERYRSVALGHEANADTLEGQLKDLDDNKDLDDDAKKEAADELRTEIQRLRKEALDLNTKANTLITDSKEFAAEATGARGRAKGAGRKFPIDPKFLQ